MKTQIKTLIAFFVFAGTLTASATETPARKSSELIQLNENLSALNEKIASFEIEIKENADYLKEAQLFTRLIVDLCEAKATRQLMERNLAVTATSVCLTENENVNDKPDFGEEARIMTKQIVDQQEEKLIKKLIKSELVQQSGNSVAYCAGF